MRLCPEPHIKPGTHAPDRGRLSIMHSSINLSIQSYISLFTDLHPLYLTGTIVHFFIILQSFLKLLKSKRINSIFPISFFQEEISTNE
jgi:hypothetical protein